MIVFELICGDRHRFEGWFSSARDFESQKSNGLLLCPVCSDSSIKKFLTAKIARPDTRPEREKPAPALPGSPRPAKLAELIDYVLLNTENVGERFPEEARRIHRKQAPLRNIRGMATPADAEELLEEGIAVVPLPVPPQKDWH